MDKAPKYVFLGFLVAVVGALVAIAVATRHGIGRPEPDLRGAGSTFVNPLMVQWSATYEKEEGGAPVAYLSSGSGRGIDRILAGSIDFACTEAPLTDEQMAKAREGGNELIHVPLVLGAVVPVYNLPEVSEPLRLTGPVLAGVYLGKVKRWDDDAIKGLNKGVADRLPAKEIIVVRRSDSSGTTHVWTDYLSKVSSEWKDKVGVGVEVKWPVGVAEDGNEGVAEKVRGTPYALGYAELTYAWRKDLDFALVRNRDGEFIRAGVRSVRAAAESLKEIPDDLRYSLTDAPGKGVYPICGTTWAVVPVKGQGAKGRRLVHFLRWAIDDGQKYAERLLYVPLPDALSARAGKQINRIVVKEGV
jgi:phosphate transport system substrate-binding protein